MKKRLHELKKGDVFLYTRNGLRFRGVFDGVSNDGKFIFYHEQNSNIAGRRKAEVFYKVVECKKDSFIAYVLAAVVLALLILGAAYALSPTIDNADMHEMTHVVASGESLWLIAQKYCPNSVRTDEWIKAVKETNRLTSNTIYPGDVLIVLAKGENNE